MSYFKNQSRRLSIMVAVFYNTITGPRGIYFTRNCHTHAMTGLSFPLHHSTTSASSLPHVENFYSRLVENQLHLLWTIYYLHQCQVPSDQVRVTGSVTDSCSEGIESSLKRKISPVPSARPYGSILNPN
jgi:hypothetical protein